MNGAVRIGVDVGGTFTDLVVLDEEKGGVYTLKVPSIPDDPSQAVLNAVKRASAELGLDLTTVLRFSHGTTVATNTILEGNGAKTALITTDGFKDVLEIQRHKRYELFNLNYKKVTPLVPRRLVIEAVERMDAKGAVITPLDEGALRASLAALAEEKVEAVAISFLFSFLNPTHERRAAEIVREVLPDCYVTISSDIYPQFREYERTSTAVVNAYLGPRVSRYFDRMDRELRGTGLKSPLFIMQSNGGTITASEAKHVPSRVVESGPAAGVIAACFCGSRAGRKRLIAFDMGGTTAKAALVEDGQPSLVMGQEIGGGINVSRLNHGAGYYVGAATVDLAEVSAGGGSIAWVDEAGLLKVGPQSAGASPGPVCYGGGGTHPTVTDANILLGRIPSDYFLGGEMKLDVEGARKAVREQIAEPLGLSVEEACTGILDIAIANMVTMMRIVSIEKGYDPREYSMLISGGAGPVMGVLLADEVGMNEVVVPPAPGLLSALGLLVADVRYEFRQTHVRDLNDADADELERIFAEMEERGRQALAQNGVAPEAMIFERSAELRYERQAFELEVGIPEGGLTTSRRMELAEAFHKAHLRKYGRAERDSRIRLVNLLLSARAEGRYPALKQLPTGAGDAREAFKGRRPVYFKASGYVDVPSYERARLLNGDKVMGPAIFEASDSTTVVPSGWTATCDVYGNLLITRNKKS